MSGFLLVTKQSAAAEGVGAEFTVVRNMDAMEDSDRDQGGPKVGWRACNYLPVLTFNVLGLAHPADLASQPTSSCSSSSSLLTRHQEEVGKCLPHILYWYGF